MFYQTIADTLEEGSAMDSYNIANIKPDSKFTGDVFVDNSFLLLPANCTITSEQISDLKEWNFTTLYTSAKVVEAQQAKTTPANPLPANASSIDEKTEVVDASEFLDDDDSLPMNSQKTEETSAPQKKEVGVFTLPQEVQQELDKAKELYDSFYNKINDIFNNYVKNKALDRNEVATVALEMCEYVKNNRGNILRIISTSEPSNKTFLINHSLISTIVAITIGIQLKLPQDKLTELTVACIVHEIGMILLPPQMYNGGKTLTAQEKLMMNTHPIVSYNILKKSGFTLTEQLAVLEHHERMNGSGYPRHVTGEKISLYAKIIAASCSYATISYAREDKDEGSTHEALTELIRNSNRQHDDIVTKVLMFSISLYPIGIYVYLSNGKVAQVVDVVPGAPKTPFVQILGETDSSGNLVTVQIDPTKLRIIRILNKKEIKDTLSGKNRR